MTRRCPLSNTFTIVTQTPHVMIVRRSRRFPTEAELSILRVLWARGPLTVRDVHERLGVSTSYTTTLKLFQNMTGKRLVRRDTAQRQHVYEAAVEENDTLTAVAGDLVDRLFNGSRTEFVLRALGSGTVSRAEIAERLYAVQRVVDLVAVRPVPHSIYAIPGHRVSPVLM